MRLENKIELPDYVLRRMVIWCCKEIGDKDFSTRDFYSALFKFTRTAEWGGGAKYNPDRIEVTICRSSKPWPKNGINFSHRLRDTPPMKLDRFGALVGVTVHELCHIYTRRRERLGAPKTRRGGRSPSGSEPRIDRMTRRVMHIFLANRATFEAEWFAEPERAAALTPPKKTRKQRNALRAVTNFKNWKTKLKLANTKQKKYARDVHRYVREEVIDKDGELI